MICVDSQWLQAGFYNRQDQIDVCHCVCVCTYTHIRIRIEHRGVERWEGWERKGEASKSGENRHKEKENTHSEGMKRRETGVLLRGSRRRR